MAVAHLKGLPFWYQLTTIISEGRNIPYESAVPQVIGIAKPGSRETPIAAKVPLDKVIEPGCIRYIPYVRNQREYHKILRPSADDCLLPDETLYIKGQSEREGKRGQDA